MILRSAALTVLTACAAGCAAPPDAARTPPSTSTEAAAFEWRLPPGLPVPTVPPGNPMRGDKVALGRRLFYDTRLSGNGTFACASCHQQSRGFTDGRPHAIGSTGQAHARNTMALVNVAYNTSYGWADYTRSTLEDQMQVPMFNEHPIELGLTGREAEIVQRFATVPDDEARFRGAFPGQEPAVTLPNIVRAIAAFERTLLSGDSPFDRYLYRDERSALLESARRGMTLFFSERLRCAECHSTFNLSGPVNVAGDIGGGVVFHNTGLYNVDGRGGYPAADRGLFDLTRTRTDMGRFRAPTLRNIAVTAPYMHDGSIATLDAVVSHYAAGGHASPMRSELVRGFRVSAAQRADLVAFLESLTDRGFLTNPAFADPGSAR